MHGKKYWIVFAIVFAAHLFLTFASAIVALGGAMQQWETFKDPGLVSGTIAPMAVSVLSFPIVSAVQWLQSTAVLGPAAYLVGSFVPAAYLLNSALWAGTITWIAPRIGRKKSLRPSAK